MIETEELEQDEQEPQNASASLSARMARRQKELEHKTTGRFPLPGFEGVLEVELRALGIRALDKIQHRSERVRDESTRKLYVAADQMIQATVGFWEVPEDGGPAVPLAGEDWISLAHQLEHCPDSPTARQALLFMVPDDDRGGLLFLVSEWQEWMRGSSREIDEETMRDFSPTG